MVTTLQSVLATLLIGVISAIAWKLWMNFRAMQRAHSEKINSVLGDLSARFPVPGSEVPRSASSPDLPSLCPSGSAPAAAVGPAPVSDKSCSTSRVGQLPAAVGSAPTPGSASAPLSTVLTAPVNVTSNAPAPPSAPAVPTAPTAGASARSSVPVTIPQELIDPEDVEGDRARLEALLPALDPAKMRAAVGARPREPGMEECCGSGCVNCVLDVYATRLDRWRERRERYLALIEPPLRVSSDANDEHGDAAVCKGPGQAEQGTIERKYDA